MDFLLFVGFMVVVSPTFLAITRKHKNAIGIIILNVIAGFFALLALSTPNLLTIGITLLILFPLYSSVHSTDNREETIELRQKLKSLNYCRTCLESENAKDIFKDKATEITDKTQELVSKGKLNYKTQFKN